MIASGSRRSGLPLEREGKRISRYCSVYMLLPKMPENFILAPLVSLSLTHTHTQTLVRFLVNGAVNWRSWRNSWGLKKRSEKLKAETLGGFRKHIRTIEKENVTSCRGATATVKSHMMCFVFFKV